MDQKWIDKANAYECSGGDLTLSLRMSNYHDIIKALREITGIESPAKKLFDNFVDREGVITMYSTDNKNVTLCKIYYVTDREATEKAGYHKRRATHITDRTGRNILHHFKKE